MGKTISLEELLTAKVSLPSEDVQIKELGGKVTVRGVTAADMESFHRAVTGPKGEIESAGFAPKLVALSVFGDVSRSDVVAKWPTNVVAELAKVAMRLNGLASGNSDATDGVGSTTD